MSFNTKYILMSDQFASAQSEIVDLLETAVEAAQPVVEVNQQEVLGNINSSFLLSPGTSDMMLYKMNQILSHIHST